MKLWLGLKYLENRKKERKNIEVLCVFFFLAALFFLCTSL
jgi:hypothetical protein